MISIIGKAQVDVVLFYEHTPDGYALYGNNMEDHVVYVEFDFELDNLKVVREGPSIIEIPANNARHKLLNLDVLNVLKLYSFRYTHEFILERDYTKIFEPEVIRDALATQDSISKIEEEAIVDADKVEEGLKAVDTILVTEVPAVKIQKIEVEVQPPIEVEIQEPVAISEPIEKEEVKVAEKDIEIKPVTVVAPPVAVISEIKKSEEAVKIPEANEKEEIEVAEEELVQKPETVISPPVVTTPEIEETEQIQEPTVEEVKEEPLPNPNPVPVTTDDIAIAEPVIEKEITPKKEIKRRFETTTKYKAAFKYQLPFMKGSEFRISQGYNGIRSHQGQFAIDFDMPLGTQVHAVREGLVSEIVQSNSKGCATQDCEKYDNYVLIHHKDGSWAKYAHLKEQSVAVSEGDMVGAGQFLGYSGSTGWTASPSLHFEILREVDDELKTVKTNFLTGDGSEYGLLMEGLYYKRDY